MNAASIYWKRLLAASFLALVCWLPAQSVLALDEKSIQGFRDAIIKLGPDVDPAEAEAVSVTAHHASRELAKEYRVVGPAVFQNFLIHVGARQRGFCAHYARDIGTRLKALRLKTLYLHWGAADANTHLEHNVIIVTALNQDYRTGYIIDGWRNAGRLCWWPVLKDSSYVWKEDLQETAWLHDYELVERKTPVHPKALAQAKAPSQTKPPTQAKALPQAKPATQPRPQNVTAGLEIKG